MTANSEIILSEHTHTLSDSDLDTVIGSPFKGDGYYGRSDGLHTVQYTYTELTGNIVIQATLALAPTESDWFEVHFYSANDETGSRIASFTGNYVWIRAVVDYTDGTINSIRLNH
jgi:hypothetical protein